MANPAKRKLSDDPSSSPTASSDSSGATAKPAAATPAAAAKPDKVVPPKAKARAKVSGNAAPTPSRHTPAKPAGSSGPSPRWVPILMFALWGIGLLLIVLNYMGVLPGASDGGNGWYLVAGLVSILAGIMVATQYR